ncbi:MAG: hypothetical protein LBQ00_04255 [Syntrophobacterales bacterium]|nr:hypothetical protein [Syntrophobacterales bacterium]
MNKLRTAIILSAKGPASETVPGTFVRTFSFAPDFVGFEGHFPGYPVLPAFIQVMTVLAMTEEVKGHEIDLISLVKAKFRAVVLPDIAVEIQYRERLVAGRNGLEATIRVPEGVAASLLLTFTDRREILSGK